jgi:hypothetical protein
LSPSTYSALSTSRTTNYEHLSTLQSQSQTVKDKGHQQAPQQRMVLHVLLSHPLRLTRRFNRILTLTPRTNNYEQHQILQRPRNQSLSLSLNRLRNLSYLCLRYPNRRQSQRHLKRLHLHQRLIPRRLLLHGQNQRLYPLVSRPLTLITYQLSRTINHELPN